MQAHYLNVRTEFDKKTSDYDLNHSIANSSMGLHEIARRSAVERLVKGNGRFLSIGCGTCWSIKHFAGRFTCNGVDVSLEMLKQCKQDNLEVCLAYGEILPIKDNAFDTVLCLNMFQYVKEPLSLLFEVKRVINGKGRFIFDFKNSLSFRAAVHHFLRIFRKHVESDKEQRYSIFEIKRFIRQADFELNRTIGMEFDFLPTSTKSIPKWVIALFRAIDYFLGSTPFRFFSGRLMVSVTSK